MAHAVAQVASLVYGYRKQRSRVSVNIFFFYSIRLLSSSVNSSKIVWCQDFWPRPKIYGRLFSSYCKKRTYLRELLTGVYDSHKPVKQLEPLHVPLESVKHKL